MLSKVFFVFFVLYLAVKLKYSKKFHCSLSHAVLSIRQGSILIFFQINLTTVKAVRRV